MTDYSHLLPDVASVMLESDDERIRSMGKPRWIGYPQALSILDDLKTSLNGYKKSRMDSLLIVGDSNNGKTTLVNRFYSVHGEPSKDSNGAVIRPIIYAQAPPRPSEKELLISILDRFHTAFRPTDTVVKLRFQLIHVMNACNVKMLIIDEIHSMLGSGSKLAEVMNVIKYLSNELMIPIVGVGTKKAVQVLHTDDQHAGRFDVRTLPKWEDNADFRSLLASFEKLLPLKYPSNLKNKALSNQIHAISGGNLGDVNKLLIACATQAIKSGKEQIDSEIIKANEWVRPTKGVRERFR